MAGWMGLLLVIFLLFSGVIPCFFVFRMILLIIICHDKLSELSQSTKQGSDALFEQESFPNIFHSYQIKG